MSVSQTALSVLGLKTVLLLAEKPCLIEIPGEEVVSTSGKSKPALGERLSQPGVCLHKSCSGRMVLESQLSTGCCGDLHLAAMNFMGFGGDWAEFATTHRVAELPKNLAGHRENGLYHPSPSNPFVVLNMTVRHGGGITCPLEPEG